MRCAIVLSDLGAGGTQRLALGLAGHLADRGHGVEVLTLDEPGFRSFFPVPPGVSTLALGLKAESPGPLHALGANLGRVRTLRRALRDQAPDLVLSFLTTTNVLTLLAARPLRLPVLACEESDPAHEPIARPWGLLRRLTYGLARSVVVHSRGAAGYFGGRLARRVRVIPNPVPPCDVSEPMAGGGSREPTLAAMGRLSPEKGFDLLISAFSQIAPRFPDWRLLILGDGPLRPDLSRQIAHLGLGGRVLLPGYSRAPSETLARASLFCSAARVEGFGLALCEAMACGLPVVATDAPSGPRDIIRPGVDGELVPVGDEAALASALAALMADEQRRRAYGERAREVTERFAPARVWALWDGLIAQAVGDGL